MGTADLHAHTCHDSWGDGNQRVDVLLRYVEENTDLDVFAITDHDSTAAAREALRLHRAGKYRFDFWPGVEITNQAGHLLCYFPSGKIVDIPSLRPFWWTVRYAREHGAVCVVAHAIYPPWLTPVLRRGLDAGLQVDGMEAANGSLSERAQVRLNASASTLENRVSLVGNSDSHDQAAIGSVRTEFPGHTSDELLRALASRNTKPVVLQRPQVSVSARRFTTRRSLTRPGWVRNVWWQMAGRHG